MPVILRFFITRAFTAGVRRTSNQTDSDVTFSRSCDQGKITIKNLKTSGLRKPPIFLKTQPSWFFDFGFFGFFEKKQVFVL